MLNETMLPARVTLIVAILAILAAPLPPPAFADHQTPLHSGYEWSWSFSDTRIALGDSVYLKVRIHDVTGRFDHGGVSVSFPDLTSRTGDSSEHSSANGDVTVGSNSGGVADVTFHERDDEVYSSRDRRIAAKHLLVESHNSSWDSSSDRTVGLWITPKRSGSFDIYLRTWLCREGWSDCDRQPTRPDTEDQQGWGVKLLTIDVSEAASAQPDLVVENASVDDDPSPSEFTVGERVTIRASVTNSGGGSAGRSRLAYQIGDSSSGRLFDTDRVASLDPGRDDDEAAKYTFTEGDVGSSYFRLVADHDSEVDEENESNNAVLIGPFTVSPEPRDRTRSESGYEWSRSFSDTRIALGDSVYLKVRIHDVTGRFDHGGVSVSFPELTSRTGDSSEHSSANGDVTVGSNSGGVADVTFHERGERIHSVRDRRIEARHLLVESHNSSWDSSSDRTVGLWITPKRSGSFDIYLRTWLCRDGWSDCVRQPTRPDAEDQQGWGVELLTIDVSEDASAQPDLRVYSNGPILAGSTMELRGSGFDGSAEVDSVELGGVLLLFHHKAITDAIGDFTATVPVPALEPGVYTLVVTAGSMVATRSIRIEEPPSDKPIHSVQRDFPASDSVFMRAGHSAAFSAVIAGRGSAEVIHWYIGGDLFLATSPLSSRLTHLYHTFNHPGSYKVEAIVFDSQGRSAKVQWDVEVGPPPVTMGPHDVRRGHLMSADSKGEMFQVYLNNNLSLRVTLRDLDGGRGLSLKFRPKDFFYTGWLLEWDDFDTLTFEWSGEGWYEIDVSPYGNGGRYELRTFVGEARLEMLFEHPIQEDMVVWVSKSCSDPEDDGATRTVRSRAISPTDETRSVSEPPYFVAFDLREFAALDSCVLYSASHGAWKISLGRALGNRVQEAALHLKNNDSTWTLNALDLPHHRLATNEAIWVPFGPSFDIEALTMSLFRFLLVDDLIALESKHASVLEKALASGLIGLTFVGPVGKAVAIPGKGIWKISAQVFGKAGEWIKNFGRPVYMKEIDGAIKRASDHPGLQRELAEQKGKVLREANAQARLNLRADYRIRDETVQAISDRLQYGGYGLINFEMALRNIDQAAEKGLDVRYSRLLERIRTANNQEAVGLISNVLQIEHLAGKAKSAIAEVKVYRDRSVDIVIPETGRGMWDNAIVQEIKQVHEVVLDEGTLKNTIDKARKQLRAASNTAAEDGATIHPYLIIDARFGQADKVNKMITKNKAEAFLLGDGKKSGYWDAMDDDIDYISILTPRGTIDLKRPGAAEIADWAAFRPGKALVD